jgi:hypothetical protein
MEYLLAFLILIGIYTLTTILSGIFGLIIPISYLFLGFILGTESLIVGAGGVLGSLVCIYAANMYIKKEGAMSHAPFYGKLASYGYITTFTIAIIIKYVFSYELTNINYWYFLPAIFILWLISTSFLKGQRTRSLDNLEESVSNYEIVKKYNDAPKWAIYLHFKNGGEGWNKTIPGSFLAKDPANDFTFVFDTKKNALRYAKDFFSKADYIDK